MNPLYCTQRIQNLTHSVYEFVLCREKKCSDFLVRRHFNKGRANIIFWSFEYLNFWDINQVAKHPIGKIL